MPRQPDREAGTFTQLARNGDFSTHCQAEVLHDPKPYAEASAALIESSLEALENAIMQAALDSHTMVAYGQGDVSRRAGDLYRNRLPWAKSNGVGYQIAADLFQFHTVPQPIRLPAGRESHRATRNFELGLEAARDFLHNLREIQTLQLQINPS